MGLSRGRRENMSILSERILLLLKERGLNQEQIAEQTGIGYRSYRRYGSGEREPSASTLTVLADFFGVSADYLLGRTEQP